MDEDELIEFVHDETSVEEIDMDYEFDAARFHDFTRAETESEAGDAERWFDFAGNYPTSRKIFFQSISEKIFSDQFLYIVLNIIHDHKTLFNGEIYYYLIHFSI